MRRKKYDKRGFQYKYLYINTINGYTFQSFDDKIKNKQAMKKLK